MTSEEQNEISKQPAETCPLIDAVVDYVQEALSDLKGWDRMEEDDLRKACDYAEWRLGNIDMEAIRDRAAEIRNWGQEWKDFAKSLQDNNKD